MTFRGMSKATANAKDAQGRKGTQRVPRSREPLWLEGDPEAVRPLQRGEGMPVFVASVALALLALAICYQHGYTLLYGDAVAHLGNARRILDAHYPGLSQLGGAWLPLPHLLMLPFVENMRMWQTGLAAAPMAMLSYAASVVGVWRLARRMMRPRWAFVAVALYALNPNLLYLATTAMTETLFLAIFVWSVVGTVECVAAVRAGNAALASRRMIFTGVMVLLEVFTRYDGWVMGTAVWCCLAWTVLRCGPARRRRLLPAFGVFTLLCAIGPVLWFWYNAHFDGDWLDFMRGPYSAKAIEAKTSKPGQHYPGWQNPGLALVYFLRAAQLDAAVWELGFALLALALYGVWLSWRPRRVPGVLAAMAERPAERPVERFALLLWAPLPFYAYSIAFGSVPIFVPQLAPHAFYNVRYGMELLPALCLYPPLAGEQLELWLRRKGPVWQRVDARFAQSTALLLCVLNAWLMMTGFGSARFLRSQSTLAQQAMQARLGGYLPAARRYAYPLVLQEGIVNAQTRVPFERSLANVLATIPDSQPVLMSVAAHVGAVQDAGRPLRSVVSENDEQAWQAALADPAHHAAYVIAMEGDPVARAVAAHPQGLAEVEVVRSTGQPITRVYQSAVWQGKATP